jgi:hypothetical protein
MIVLGTVFWTREYLFRIRICGFLILNYEGQIITDPAWSGSCPDILWLLKKFVVKVPGTGSKTLNPHHWFCINWRKEFRIIVVVKNFFTLNIHVGFMRRLSQMLAICWREGKSNVVRGNTQVPVPLLYGVTVDVNIGSWGLAGRIVIHSRFAIQFSI